MDAVILANSAFWRDLAPVAAGDSPGDIPDLPELRGHVLFETSGSSGAPKWIALSKHALMASAIAVNRHLHITHHSCWGLALPLRHVGGFGVAARAFAAGCRLETFNSRWDPRAFMDWLAETRVTHTSLVPTQVHDLSAAGLHAPGSLRTIVVGGGHLDLATGLAARALGWPVLASYGMTEAASQIATQPLAALDARYHPAPLPLLPIWQAAISPEGKLRIAGPALFSGILVRENDAWAFKPRESDWHQTEDRVELENNLLTPLGRADLRVKVLGELVDIEAIEHELAARSNKSLAPGSFVVVAVPDGRAGHALVPVFDETADRRSIDAALAAYAATAPGFRRLKAAVFLADFPRSPLGKPRRGEITIMVSGHKKAGAEDSPGRLDG
jgi:o-succinylbenzoate---CoA ligase